MARVASSFRASSSFSISNWPGSFFSSRPRLVEIFLECIRPDSKLLDSCLENFDVVDPWINVRLLRLSPYLQSKQLLDARTGTLNSRFARSALSVAICRLISGFSCSICFSVSVSAALVGGVRCGKTRNTCSLKASCRATMLGSMRLNRSNSESWIRKGTSGGSPISILKLSNF